jgi:DNA modification methylase
MENKTEDIKISRLETNRGQIDGLPKNPRFIRDERYKALVKSIEDAPEMLKLRELIVVEHGSKFVVIGGNMRLRACKDLGMETVPCKVLPADTPTEKLREYAIKDNNGFGEDDWDVLANEWDAEELQDWGVELPMDWDVDGGEALEASEDDFDESEVTEAVCKRGEVWKLGEHRLMCGDSTSEEDFAKLMGEERAELCLTDLPYGVNVVSNDGKVGADFGVAKKGIYKQIIADDTTDTAEMAWRCVSDLSEKQIIFGGNYFTKFLPFSDAWLIWDKRGESGIRNTFADAEMAWCSFHTPVRVYHQLWNGMIREGEHEKRVHPTQKPVKMIGDIMSDFTKEGDIVLDAFGGSGTTIIAAEQLNRKCRMMELDPHYCDVIIARWEKLTGQKAERISDG